MEFWLDSCHLETVKNLEALGVLYGVTTNPQILSQSNLSRDEVLKELLSLQKGPVAAQVGKPNQKLDCELILEEAHDLMTLSERIIVKIPVTQEGLKAMKILAEEEAPIMATCIFAAKQTCLAACNGAKYAAVYYSRIAKLGIDPYEEVKKMQLYLEKYELSTKLLIASLKEEKEVLPLLLTGIQGVTLRDPLFKEFVSDHPSTLTALQEFGQLP